MTDLDDSRLSLGTEPIPGGDPAGENARDDTEFDTLSTEVAKMDVDGPNAVDWRKVQELSEALLRDRTKDYLIAAYYAYALGREEGMRGLAVGLGVFAGMVETFWDSGFPPPRRERARVGAADWLAERFGPTLADVEVTADNAVDILATLRAAEEVDRLLDEKTEKTQANLGELLRPLRGKRQDAQFILDEKKKAEEAAAAATDAATDAATAAPEPEAEKPAESDAAEPAPAPSTAPSAAPSAPTQAPPPAQAAPAAGGPAPAVVAAPVTPTASGPELERAVSAMRSNMLGFARGLRAANGSDPRAYALHRLAVWLPVTDLPPDTGGETLLPAPQGDVVSSIDGLVNAANPAALIERCESVTEDSLFWLDPHRHVANALGAQGLEPARRAVVSEVAALLLRFPRLIELKFQGGTPFADEQTRLWLTETVLPSGGGDGTGGGGDESTVAQALSEARGLAANGKLDEAAEVLTNGGRTAGGGRTRLLWDMAKAELCMAIGETAAAYQMLSELDAKHCGANLEDWDPAIAERMAGLLLQSVKRGGADPILGEEGAAKRSNELAARLYRLNMSSALGIMRA
jgi:type VI secretion system protein VasJ